jgi:hypothetical protein
MDSGLVNILMGVLGGGVGGNIVGALMKNRSMGPTWNTILGACGGLLGGQLAGSGGAGGELGVGAVGGVVVTLIGSFLRKKKPAAGA